MTYMKKVIVKTSENSNNYPIFIGKNILKILPPIYNIQEYNFILRIQTINNHHFDSNNKSKTGLLIMDFSPSPPLPSSSFLS